MSPIDPQSGRIRTGVDRHEGHVAGSEMPGSFAYEQCDIPPGYTLSEWRHAHAAHGRIPRGTSLWSHMQRRLGL